MGLQVQLRLRGLHAVSTIVRVSYDTECGGTSKPAPATHATSHKTGGSDAIKLDELAAPTDVTTLNVSSTAHGLQPKHPNDATKFLSGAGTYLALDQLHLALNVGALTPGTTVSWDAATAITATLTPGQNETINVTGAVTGRLYSLAVTTSGTTSWNLTFGTNFVTASGVLATGTVTAKKFVVLFLAVGTELWEVARTGAM